MTSFIFLATKAIPTPAATVRPTKKVEAIFEEQGRIKEDIFVIKADIRIMKADIAEIKETLNKDHSKRLTHLETVK